MNYIIGTKSVIDSVEAQLDDASGLPAEGVDAGVGEHVVHNKETGVGWTLHLAPRSVLVDGRHALMVVSPVQDLLDSGRVTLPASVEQRPLTRSDLPAPSQTGPVRLRTKE